MGEYEEHQTMLVSDVQTFWSWARAPRRIIVDLRRHIVRFENCHRPASFRWWSGFSPAVDQVFECPFEEILETRVWTEHGGERGLIILTRRGVGTIPKGSPWIHRGTTNYEELKMLLSKVAATTPPAPWARRNSRWAWLLMAIAIAAAVAAQIFMRN